MTWTHYLFGFHGRLNRARYWAFIGTVYAVAFVAAAVAIAVVGTDVSMHSISMKIERLNPTVLICVSLVVVILEIAFVAASLAVATKRLHDRAKGAWWLLVFVALPVMLRTMAVSSAAAPGGRETAGMLSVVAFAFAAWGFVEMACLRGTDGPNRFGPDPLNYTANNAEASFG
jgi:uncharacterized membrane protein YhaH (DUF805 family)